MVIGPFPSSVAIGPLAVPLHLIFESLAYFVGFRLYLRQRRLAGDFLSSPDRWWIVTAAIAGAAIGSKIGAWMEDPAATLHHWNDPFFLLGGKTIVGGLLGGTIAVEWIKHRLGIVSRTGDLFAIPLAIAIAIGRIGCFFGGLRDGTSGTPASLPWAVDFGDGIPRHPTQLYEMAAIDVLSVHSIAGRKKVARFSFPCALQGEGS
jgi:phosphatidylglycerol---prolipoprotein diacylglyceryl transferase